MHITIYLVPLKVYCYHKYCLSNCNVHYYRFHKLAPESAREQRNSLDPPRSAGRVKYLGCCCFCFCSCSCIASQPLQNHFPSHYTTPHHTTPHHTTSPFSSQIPQARLLYRSTFCELVPFGTTFLQKCPKTALSSPPTLTIWSSLPTHSIPRTSYPHSARSSGIWDGSPEQVEERAFVTSTSVLGSS
jgi:hypothetical protein